MYEIHRKQFKKSKLERAVNLRSTLCSGKAPWQLKEHSWAGRDHGRNQQLCFLRIPCAHDILQAPKTTWDSTNTHVEKYEILSSKQERSAERRPYDHCAQEARVQVRGHLHLSSLAHLLNVHVRHVLWGHTKAKTGSHR